MFKKKNKKDGVGTGKQSNGFAFENQMDNIFARRPADEMIRRLYSKELSHSRLGRKQVSKTRKVMAVAVLTICAIAVSLVYNYNRFIVYKERIASSRGQIAAELQRRANLFNNLVSLALDYASLEREVFDHVAEVRNNLNIKNGAGEGITENGPPVSLPGGKDSIADMSSIEQSLSRLTAVVERYPDLKSNQTYKYLMENITEIENRITGKRGDYNENVKNFNNKISIFPWKYMAKVFGFKREEYFESTPDEKINPKLLPDYFYKILPERGQRKSKR